MLEVKVTMFTKREVTVTASRERLCPLSYCSKPSKMKWETKAVCLYGFGSIKKRVSNRKCGINIEILHLQNIQFLCRTSGLFFSFCSLTMPHVKCFVDIPEISLVLQPIQRKIKSSKKINPWNGFVLPLECIVLWGRSINTKSRSKTQGLLNHREKLISNPIPSTKDPCSQTPNSNFKAPARNTLTDNAHSSLHRERYYLWVKEGLNPIEHNEWNSYIAPTS